MAPPLCVILCVFRFQSMEQAGWVMNMIPLIKSGSCRWVKIHLKLALASVHWHSVEN